MNAESYSIEIEDALADELPKSAEHFILMCKYKGGGWLATGTLHRHAIDAENDKNIWADYENYRIVRVVLPL